MYFTEAGKFFFLIDVCTVIICIIHWRMIDSLTHDWHMYMILMYMIEHGYNVHDWCIHDSNDRDWYIHDCNVHDEHRCNVHDCNVHDSLTPDCHSRIWHTHDCHCRFLIYIYMLDWLKQNRLIPQNCLYVLKDFTKYN